MFCYRCLIGIKSTPGDPQVLASPLAWSDPDAEDLLPAYERASDAARAVYGYSEKDLINSNLFTRRADGMPGEFKLK